MIDFKLIIYKFKLNFIPRFTKDQEFNYILKKSGIKVGNHTIFYAPETMQIDRSRPYLLEIGSYCKITAGTIILTHDYSRSVLRRTYGEIVGEGKKTIIGDNVFIGMNSIILMGTTIGNNVIIGAGSVVHGNIPDNCVVAGNPAKIIRSLDEHYQMRKNKTIDEAIECVDAFYASYGRFPNIKEIGPFWQLFLKRDIDLVKKSGVNYKLNGDDSEEVLNDFMLTKPTFDGYESFLEYYEKIKKGG